MLAHETFKEKNAMITKTECTASEKIPKTRTIFKSGNIDKL